MENANNVTDPTLVDTQSQTAATPASEVSGNVENQTSQVAEGSSAPQPTQTDAEREALAQRREEGKLRQVQQQLEEERKKSQAYAEWIASRPERLQEALIEQGYTVEQASAKIGELRNKGYWNQPVQQTQSSYQQPVYNQQVDPYTAVKEVLLMEKFLSEAPDLDFRGKSLEEAESARASYMSVASVAESLINAGVARDEMSALRKAYQIVTGKETLPNRQASENARYEALATSVANQSGVSQPSVGGVTARSTVSLTEAQRQAAQANGMTDEEYAKYL